MDATSQVRAILSGDPLRWRLLDVVRSLDLPDSWVGAGFVRNAVWDHLHQRAPLPPDGDVDVIWYDLRRTDPAEDLKLEEALRSKEPSVIWSVKNQARMHERNGDQLYASATDAMRYWPETATAVAARRNGDDFQVAAPLGLDDLFGLVLRPTPHFSGRRRIVYDTRLQAKAWTESWPLLNPVAC